MTFHFEPQDRNVIAAALDEVIPGCVELGALDYLEELLGALDHEPPHIWAAPTDTDGDWLELGPWERHAWQLRISEWRAGYGRIATGTATDADRRMLHTHACEATYADPAYGGNRDGAAWRRIGFPEPMFPPTRSAARSDDPILP